MYRFNLLDLHTEMGLYKRFALIFPDPLNIIINQRQRLHDVALATLV